jgi:ATP-dependent helicase/nuclease subunit A
VSARKISSNDPAGIPVCPRNSPRAALRSPGLACSDVDLATWTWRDGKWSYLSVDYALVEPSHPVSTGLRLLRDLHRERYWLSIGEMVRRVIDVCHLHELAFAHARPRDRWRRIEFFLAQARAFEAAGGSSIEIRLIGS